MSCKRYVFLSSLANGAPRRPSAQAPRPGKLRTHVPGVSMVKQCYMQYAWATPQVNSSPSPCCATPKPDVPAHHTLLKHTRLQMLNYAKAPLQPALAHARPLLGTLCGALSRSACAA